MTRKRKRDELGRGVRGGIALGLAAAFALAACGGEVEETTGRYRGASTTCGGQPATPALFAQPIDDYAAYDGQDTCLSTEQPGVVAFRELVMATYPCTSAGGILRDCAAGGTSEHKEGRAWDWMVDVGDRAPEDLLAWLLAPDASGNTHAMARRLGLMYIVWNRQIWRAYRAEEGWLPYSGSSPHTDHVHFSFSWAGARKETSFWSGSGTSPPDPAPPPAGEDDPPPAPACGDGVLDPGELCDPAITAGPGVCPVGCDDGDPCTREVISGSACNPQCVQVRVELDPVVADGCCPPGATREIDADCLAATSAAEPAACDPGSPGCAALGDQSVVDRPSLMGGCNLGPDGRAGAGGAGAFALLWLMLALVLRRGRK